MNEHDKELQWSDLDLRYVELFHAITALRMYLELMEQQMPIVEAAELAALEANRPPGNDEEQQSLHWNEVNYLEQLFDEDLFPTMRYSFVVFIHTVFETRLRAFCVGEQRRRKLPISITDLSGSAVDQANAYLTKLVGVAVGSFPEWAHLRRFQSIRDCIVHHYGYLHANDSRHVRIREFADSSDDITIADDDRIRLTRSFCEHHLTNIESFFERLIAAADGIK
ncbi:MAG: hypothetical protein WAO00_10980 [Chthoniobacterales bacterium]